MSKRNRYKHWADDTNICGVLRVPLAKGEVNERYPKGKIYFFRKRKARRAQARLDGYVWRAMSFEQRMTQ